MARCILPALSAGLLLSSALLASCQDSAPTAPRESVDAVEVASLGARDQAITAMFRVTLDPATLEASVSPVALREMQNQPPQAISYDLDIANFQNGASFRIAGVETTPDGDLLIHWTHAHPFPAPNFTLPVTSLNRADLGYTGRLLVIPNGGTTRSFFDGSVFVNPDLVRNADGYLSPGDLLASPALGSQNTFPYKLLVNELDDSRIGVSNGDDPTGNYSPTVGGWQRDNIGASGNGWTGFDYLHGGQTSAGSLQLSSEALAAGGSEFDVAILIKYTDPRGAGGKTLRFPPATPDVTQFAYRLPFSALDCSQVVGAEPDYSVVAQAGATVDVELRVRDWDAGANASGDANLSDEPDVSKVQPGAPGVPSVEIDPSPFDSAVIVASGLSGTGRPGDEMRFAATITNTELTDAGPQAVCVRVIDDEEFLDDSSYHFGVDPVTALPTRTPLHEITYQVLQIEALPPAPVILGVGPIGDIGVVGDTVQFLTTVVNQVDSVSWVFDPVLTDPPSSSENFPEVELLGIGTFTGTLTATGPGGTTAPFPFEVTIGAPPIPEIFAVNPNLLFILSPRQFSLGVEGTPTAWQWDFGLGAFPRFSTEESPIVTAPEPGSFRGHVVVSNAGGQSAPFEFEYLVVSGFDPFFEVVTLPVALTELTLVPTPTAVCLAGFAANGAVDVAVVPAADALVPENWVTYEVEPANTDGDRQDMSGTIHNGRFVLLYFHDNAEAMRVAHAEVDVPVSAADWRTYNLFGFATNPVVSTYSSIMSFNGRLAAVFRAKSTGQLLYARALVAEPTSFSDWSVYSIDDNDSVTFNTDMTEIDGRLSVAYQRSGSLLYGRAQITEPLVPADWFSGNAGVGPAGRVALEGLAERAVILNIPPNLPEDLTDDLELRIAMQADPDSFQWERTFVQQGSSNIYGGLDAEVVDGRLTVGLELSDAAILQTFFAQSALPDSPLDFEAGILSTGGAADVNAKTLNGKLCYAFRDTDDQARFALDQSF